MEAGRRHPDEAELLAFLQRKDQSSDYVRRTAEWITKNYPGSEASMLPRLRQIYKEKRREGQ